MVQYNILAINGSKWETPATHYLPIMTEKWRLRRARVPRGTYPAYGMRGYHFFQYMSPVTVIELQEQRNGRWYTWMVDDPQAWTAMQLYGEQFYGNVIIGGLGLGLVVHALKTNPAVKRITVVERDAELASLMRQNIPDVEILCTDWWDFIQDTDGELIVRPTGSIDCILLDFWVASNRVAAERNVPSVLRMGVLTKVAFPGARLSIHGYERFSDIRLTDPVIMQECIALLRSNI